MMVFTGFESARNERKFRNWVYFRNKNSNPVEDKAILWVSPRSGGGQASALRMFVLSEYSDNWF